MKRKIVWLVVSSLMVLSLVMASCAPAAVEEEKAPVTEEKAPEEKVEKEVVAPTVEKPKYGGVLRLGETSDITDFDEVVGSMGPISSRTLQNTNERLCQGDWTKGPAGGYGTNETTWGCRLDLFELYTGYIAESWELPTKIEGEIATVTYKIRKGVHWALNPASEASRLVGGRELTADDVVFSLTQQITDPRAYIYRVNPELRGAKITSPAPWTVKVEFPWDAFFSGVTRFSYFIDIVPPEVCAKYGTMANWKVSVGTGPFMLTDFVAGSTATMVRNPNYWMKDPIGPGKGNQLPYLDGVKILIIVDTSTLYAALRTAKIDLAGAIKGGTIKREDRDFLLKTAPQMKSKAKPQLSASGIDLRRDRAPFNDIRVRRALMMAIDFEAVKRDYFLGEAQILTWPISYVEELANAYLGLDDPECPESVRELYVYNPEKAKALLKEAGYPAGFKAKLAITTAVETIDYYSIYKDMWSKVGVDLTFDLKESAAFSIIKAQHVYDEMVGGMGAVTSTIYKMLNVSYYQQPLHPPDPVVEEAFTKIQRATVTGIAEADRLHKELMKYVLPQVWAIPRVYPYNYTLWWPWLKNYSGEETVGYYNDFYRWVWLDQELKKSMGY